MLYNARLYSEIWLNLHFTKIKCCTEFGIGGVVNFEYRNKLSQLRFSKVSPFLEAKLGPIIMLLLTELKWGSVYIWYIYCVIDIKMEYVVIVPMEDSVYVQPAFSLQAVHCLFC